MLELKENYTIAIVTHNLQQATRVADRPRSCTSTRLRAADRLSGGIRRFGELFDDPQEEYTKQYLRGEFS